MKKICLSIAALLLSLLAHSQEADTLGRHAEFTIIPRLDGGLTSHILNRGFDKAQFNLGTSSLYTLFEGSISEHVSFILCNHWLAAGEGAPRWLYDGTLRSDMTNWIDYCCLEFNAGPFTFGIGKDSIFTGGFEFDEWDYDCHPEMNTALWNVLPVYQWGASVGYTTPSEMTTFSLQMAASPFGEHPFSSGLWAWSGKWTGEYGPLSTLWTATAAQNADRKLEWLVCLGQKLALGDWTLEFDWFSKVGLWYSEYDCEEFPSLIPPFFYNDYWEDGSTLLGRVVYSPIENLELEAKYIFEGKQLFKKYGDGLRTGGLAVRWMTDDFIRLHAAAGYSDHNIYGDFNGMYANLGVTFFINVNKLFRKK